jgi:hypothetical protein
MAVRLSALSPGLLLPPGRFLVLISVRDSIEPTTVMRLEGLGQLKKSNDFIGNRNRDVLYSSLWTVIVLTTAVFGFKCHLLLICVDMENIVATARRGAEVQWLLKSTFYLPACRFFTSLWDSSYMSTYCRSLSSVFIETTDNLRSVEQCKQRLRFFRYQISYKPRRFQELNSQDRWGSEVFSIE